MWSDLALLWSTTKEPEQDEFIDFRLLNGSSNSLHLFFMDADRISVFKSYKYRNRVATGRDIRSEDRFVCARAFGGTMCISQIFKVQKDQQSSRLIWTTLIQQKGKEHAPVPAVEFPRLPQLIDSLLQYQFKLQVDAKHYFYQIRYPASYPSSLVSVVDRNVGCSGNGHSMYYQWERTFHRQLGNQFLRRFSCTSLTECEAEQKKTLCWYRGNAGVH